MTPKPPAPTRVVYATAASASIAEIVTKLYGLKGDIQCELLNRGFNDTFLVRSSEREKYVFRLSQHGRRDQADIAAETTFLTCLHKQGIPVAAPRAALDGSLYSHIQLPDGDRPAVLFHYLEGRPADELDLGDARMQGRTLARIHDAVSNFDERNAGTHRADVDHLLLKPLKKILTLQTVEPEAREYLVALAERLSESIVMDKELSWTRCHGDCHGGNARMVAAKDGGEEAAFFDFDDGGFGYLSYDLAVHLWAHVSFGCNLHHIWHAFVDGYRDIRSIEVPAFEAMHRFVMIRHIWLLGEYASRVAEWGTENLPNEWLNSQADFLRRWEEERLSPGLLRNLH